MHIRKRVHSDFYFNYINFNKYGITWENRVKKQVKRYFYIDGEIKKNNSDTFKGFETINNSNHMLFKPLTSPTYCSFEVDISHQCGVNASGMKTAKLSIKEYIYNYKRLYILKSVR